MALWSYSRLLLAGEGPAEAGFGVGVEVQVRVREEGGMPCTHSTFSSESSLPSQDEADNLDKNLVGAAEGLLGQLLHAESGIEGAVQRLYVVQQGVEAPSGQGDATIDLRL
jgi:hypothetical protein